MFFQGLRNVVPRQGTETLFLLSIRFSSKPLRNVVPRQGTETLEKFLQSLCISFTIEKCSSPTGDGNNNLSPLQFQNYH